MPPNRKPKLRGTSLQLPRHTRNIIRKEATALSLTEAEYTALVSQLAQAIRGSILPDGTKDPALFRTLLDNPLLLSLAAAMAGSVWTALKEQMTNADPTQEDGPSTAPQAPRPTRTTVQPYGYPQYYGMEQRPVYPGQAYPPQAYPGQAYPGSSGHPLPEHRTVLPGPPAQEWPPRHYPTRAARSPLAPSVGRSGPITAGNPPRPVSPGP